MTPRSFFTIFLKVLGIFLIYESIGVIPQGLLTVLSITENGNASIEIFSVIIFIVFIISIYLIVLKYFVFKTELVIDKLQLDKGFIEEKFELNIHRSTILRIATIVTGGLIFINNLPAFCQYTYNYFEQTQFSGGSPKSEWLIFYFLKTLLGYFLLTNSRLIVAFIEKQRLKV